MFETTRLRLRAFEDADAAPYCAWWNDAALVGYQTQGPVRPVTREANAGTLKSWVNDSLIFLCAETRDTAEMIGMVNLWGGEAKNRDVKLAIVIGRPQWGMGYGREMLRFLTRYAFTDLGVHRISLQVAARNARAVRCYQAVGFREEGRLREATLWNDRWEDELLMGMLRADLPNEDAAVR